MRFNCFRIIAIAFSLIAVNDLSGQDCSCVDCPIDIFNLQTHTSTIDVQVAGSNDLGDCGLNQVCFTIAHTWVGDLSVSLVSPSGLKYLVMADAENMPPNGCGNSENNIDICIETGTSNPITNNTEYVCNGTGAFCMEGNGFTVPCGGVTDPFDGALQAPNCDLADFNVSGHSANGQWTLVINDICDLNIGQLIDWSISFDCGTSSCLGCDADGGDLTFPDFEACMGATELDLELDPVYMGTAPDPLLFDYSYLIIDSGFIVEVSSDPDLQSYGAGIYSVCGISYETGQLAAVEGLVGTAYSSIGTNLGICFDGSASCLGIEIFEPISAYTELVELCFGNCHTGLDGIEYCTSGLYVVNYESVGGCISTMTIDLNIEEEFTSTEQFFVCIGEEVLYNSQSYSAGTYTILLNSTLGCDSTVTLSVEEVPVDAIITPDALNFDCTTNLIKLFSTGSTFENLRWLDDAGNLLGSEDSLSINTAGTYYLEASSMVSNGTCMDTSMIIVDDLGELPEVPIFTLFETGLCINEQITFCVLLDSNVDTWEWVLPSGAGAIGDDSSQCIEVLFSEILSGEEICVSGLNACGQGASSCISLDVDEEPLILNVFEDCDLSTESFDLEIVVSGIGLSVVSSTINIFDFDGSTFSAENLAGGLSYFIEFESANCGLISVSNTNDCLCGNADPFLVGGSPEKCIGEPIEFVNTGPLNNSLYATAYILHSDPSDALNSILMISDLPIFEYDATIIPTGVLLYVTGVRGKPLPISNDPFIDLDDPCLTFSNQLVFEYKEPEPIVAYIPDICIGDPLQLSVEGNGGPFMVYVNGFGYDFSGSGNILLLPSLTGNYTLEYYEDGNGCAVDMNMNLLYEVHVPGDIGLTTATADLCNSTWNGETTSVDLSTFLINNTPGSWTDVSNSGALLGSIFDAEGIEPGLYTLEFTTDEIGSCPSESLSLTVEVVACACPELESDAYTICNSENYLDLSLFVPDGLEGGIWSLDLSGSVGSAPLIEFGALIFDATVSGDFSLFYDYSDLGFLGCPTVDTLYLEINSLELVSLSEERVDICISDLPLNLSDFEPQDVPGSWSYLGTQDVVLNEDFIELAEVGSHILYFNADATQDCTIGMDSLQVVVLDVPQRLNAADKFIEKYCYENGVQIGSSTLCSQTNYEFLWHTISGSALSDIYACQPLVTEAGVYELIVYDMDTNCETVDTVFVSEAEDEPEFDIIVDPITCFGDSDGEILFNSINVTYQPYTMFLNGEIVEYLNPIENLGSGSYELLMVDSEGCTVEKALSISEPSEMALNLMPFDPIVQIGTQVSLEAQSNYPDVVFNWETISGNYNDYGPFLDLTVFFNQSVGLEAINSAGCIRQLEIELEALDKYKVFVPNIFSPNNDGINDGVTIFSGSDINIIRSFRIFSRWGGLVYENYNFSPNDLDLGWNGFVDGQKAAEGDYVWYAEVEIETGESRMFKGDIALVR